MENIKQELETALETIKTFLQVDAAVFDPAGRLVAATDEYIRQKGRQVHTPGIKDVLAQGSVIVHTPGRMPACAGCRFAGNCPAKIEILGCIRNGSAPLGVMTFTAFTPQGHDRMAGNTPAYVSALNLFSGWIAHTAGRQERDRRLVRTRALLDRVMELSGESFLALDAKGMVSRCNPPAHDFFSFCDLYTRSAYHILPEALVEKILAGETLGDVPCAVRDRHAVVSARPLPGGEAGAVVRIRHTGPAPTQPGAGYRPGQAAPNPDDSPDAFLGESQEIRRVRHTVEKLKPSQSTLLITGDTGTGKGLLARIIHKTGARARGPFVTVNCASIPDALFESELFGYEEGAFTGAKKGGKPGRFELARGGTLFLDEIGEMPVHLQAKLLNVLQDNALQRVGGITQVALDVRVIAATNQDLDQLVREKSFRSDLFFRLSVIPIDLPPLAGRRQDIELLARTFLKESGIRAGTAVTDIAPDVMDLFRAHHWPGNVRELQNIIEYGVNMADGTVITLDSLPERFPGRTRGTAVPLPGPQNRDFKTRVRETEKDAILACLDRLGHDTEGKKQAARELGISLRTLYRKLS